MAEAKAPGNNNGLPDERPLLAAAQRARSEAASFMRGSQHAATVCSAFCFRQLAAVTAVVTADAGANRY